MQTSPHRHRRWPMAMLGLLASCGQPPVPIGSESYANSVCPKGATTDGMDIASCQIADWPTVKGAGIDFALIKATEGDGSSWSYENPRFQYDWPGSKAAGVLRGAYHYFHPELDGKAQADYLLATIDKYGGLHDGDLPPMLDWEEPQCCGSAAASCGYTSPSCGESSSAIAASAQAFVDEIRARTGRQTLIYTYPYYWEYTAGAPSAFASEPLNISSFNTCPDVPAPWTDWSVWQYSTSSRVSGVSPGSGCTSDVDVDRFNGSLSDLIQWATPTQPLAQLNGNDSISLVNWPDGHAEAFSVTPAGELVHVATKDSGDLWGSLAMLDSGASCGLASVFWRPPYSYPEVFSPRPDGTTGHLWWASGAWNTFHPYGGMNLSHLQTLTWPDAHSEVFALGADGAIWHDYWDYSKGDWSGWASLGGSVKSGPSPILWADGHAELFATNAAGVPYHTWTGASGWSSWQPLTSSQPLASRPVPVRWADGHGELFATGRDGHLYHSVAGATGFAPFQLVDGDHGLLGEPSVIYNPKGGGGGEGPEIFARDDYGRVVHLWWSGSSYGAFIPLDDEESASDPFGWIRADGSGEVFAIDPAGALARDHRDTSGRWSGWGTIATGIDGCSSDQPTVTQVHPTSPASAAGSGGNPSGTSEGGCSVVAPTRGGVERGLASLVGLLILLGLLAGAFAYPLRSSRQDRRHRRSP